jgi:hypothetical protein
MMRRLPYARWPILLGMALIALPSLLVYGNWLHTLLAGVPMYSDTKLNGVQVPVPKPELDFNNFASGTYGREWVAWFGQHFPLLAPAVRLKAQFYWSVLHKSSPVQYIVVGREDTLFEQSYLSEYCSRDIAAFRPVAQAWAAKLARMQAWYATRGKLFVYVITPSKAASEAELMPPAWPCAASPADRAGFHQAYMAILRAANVNVADAVQSTLAAKQAYPFPPFPQGGTHFNTVASARAVQAIIASVNGASAWRRMNDLEFTWTMGTPNEVDTDLLDAMNVPWPGMHYQTPDITVTTPRSGRCEPVIMGQVGGSFAYQIDKVFQRMPCPPQIDLYEYFHNTMAFYPGDRRYPVDSRRREWMLTGAAQVILLEENEELVARSDHGEALYELILRTGKEGS